MNEIKNGGICSTLHSNRKYFICAKIVRRMRNTINSPTHCNGRSETTELIYSILQQIHLQELHEHEPTTGELKIYSEMKRSKYVLLCLILKTYLDIPQDKLRYTKQMEDISQCNDRLL